MKTFLVIAFVAGCLWAYTAPPVPSGRTDRRNTNIVQQVTAPINQSVVWYYWMTTNGPTNLPPANQNVTNVVRNMATNGVICRVLGHKWQAYSLSGTPPQKYRDCPICGTIQKQDWH